MRRQLPGYGECNGTARTTIGLHVATTLQFRRPEKTRAPRRERQGSGVLKGVLAGAAGGLAGAFAMAQFAQAWSRITGTQRTSVGTREEMEAAGNVVDIFTRRVLKVKLRKPRQTQAATGFHYAAGLLLGAGYGALAEMAPEITAGAGAPFGALEWLLGIRFVAPRAGLLRPRREYSKQERLQTFAAHVVFGVAAEAVRSSLRRELAVRKGGAPRSKANAGI